MKGNGDFAFDRMRKVGVIRYAYDVLCANVRSVNYNNQPMFSIYGV